MRATQEPAPKLKWIHAVVGTVGSPDALGGYARRLADLVKTRGGEAVMVKAQSRFVTGLGRSHPVENGFSWHPTLGTPYLAGSSLKGLARAWAKANGQDDGEVARLLGGPDRAGTVAFLDAVPPYQVTLEADVLTPHYANWTEQEKPGDWRSPRPVPFLVAAPGLSLLCGLLPLRAKDGDVATAKRWLISALAEAGAGAKTAIGYGHFEEDPQDSTLARWRDDHRQREVTATPEGRWRLALARLSEEELLNAVRENLVRAPLADPGERRAFVGAVLDRGMVSSWRRGERTEAATSTGGKKLKEYARAVLSCAAEFDLDPPE